VANEYQQGIHVLLNNCPKLTHLSLTGVQAFLRDELLAFCREAPPEFNDHQRDVFCVFSGGGVARLREYLNDQKRQAVAPGSVTPSVESDAGIDIDVDGDMPDSDGSNTPVISLDVHSTHAPGATPIIPGAGSGLLFASAMQNQNAWQQNHHHGHGGHDNGGSANLSQSAPASTGGPSAMWGQAPPPPPFHGHGGGAGAQHVTGMMGATILDDVDEGDEAFGEGSEIMGD